MSAGPSSSGRGERTRELFAAAIERNEAERRAFLDAQCAGDPQLRRDVESLLGYYEPDSRFLETPAVRDGHLTLAPGESQAVGTLAPGTVVAGFTVARVLGAGGMGVVYEAVQASPRRAVALKLMRAGLVTRAALRRFEQEGAALARLKHEGIAQVYQAGSEQREGVLTPFIAMELVEGEALGAYVARVKPTVDERLAVFVQVCEAVAHAHQRGVLHRDLKPANILVISGAVGARTKILDFGIARLTDEEGATVTQAGMMPGTVAYMSPEQLGPDPAAVDARSDVYALGVLLYELLAGRLPVDPTRLTLAEAARRVREEEPARLGAIDRRLRGDLETIARKALEKDPARRYGSASELAEDVRRHQRHEPIAARPPTLGYVASRFARRHRAVVVAAGAIVLALGAGLAASLHQAAEARRQLEIAQQTALLLEEIFSSVEPQRALGREVTVREAIDAASAKLERSGIESPEILGSLHGTIGRIYAVLGEMETGLRHQREALRHETAVHGEDHPATLIRVATVGQMLYSLGRLPEARALLQPAAERSERLHGEGAEATLRLLTALGNAVGHVPESVTIHRRVVGIIERTRGAEDEAILYPVNNLGVALLETGKYDEALKVLDRCDRLRRKHLVPTHPDHVVTLQNIMAAHEHAGHHEQAAAAAQRMISEGDRIFGPRHAKQVYNRYNAVMALVPAGQLEASLKLAEENVRYAQTPEGRETEMSVRCRGLRAQLLIMLKRFEEARAAIGETDAATIALYGPDDPEKIMQPWTLWYDFYEATGEPAKQAEWRAKIATTARGRKMLAAEAPPKSAPAPGGEPAPKP